MIHDRMTKTIEEFIFCKDLIYQIDFVRKMNFSGTESKKWTCHNIYMEFCGQFNSGNDLNNFRHPEQLNDVLKFRELII